MSPMSFRTLCAIALLAIAVIPEYATAHISLLYPPPRGGFGTNGFDFTVHEFVGYDKFKFPCGGYKKLGPNFGRYGVVCNLTTTFGFFSSLTSNRCLMQLL